jgi:hypothetical protein
MGKNMFTAKKIGVSEIADGRVQIPCAERKAIAAAKV